MPNGKRAETATDPSSSGEEDAGLKFFDLAATRLDSRKHRSRPPQLPPVVESVGASAEYPGTACMALGTQASRDLGWNRSSWSDSARPPTRGTGVRHRTGSSGGRDSPPGGMSGDIAGLESVVSAEPHAPPKLHRPPTRPPRPIPPRRRSSSLTPSPQPRTPPEPAIPPNPSSKRLTDWRRRHEFTGAHPPVADEARQGGGMGQSAYCQKIWSRKGIRGSPQTQQGKIQEARQVTVQVEGSKWCQAASDPVTFVGA